MGNIKDVKKIDGKDYRYQESFAVRKNAEKRADAFRDSNKIKIIPRPKMNRFDLYIRPKNKGLDKEEIDATEKLGVSVQ